MMYYIWSMNIYNFQLVLISNCVNCLWNSYLYGFWKLFLVGVHVRTHMNIRLAHGLVHNYVLQVIDMEMPN
jgi:hypothetical protein